MTKLRPWHGELAEPPVGESFQSREFKDELVKLAGLWRRRYWIFGIAFATAVAAALITVNMTPIYSAASQVMLRANLPPDIIDPRTVTRNLVANDAVIQGEVNVLTAPELLREVAAELGLDKDPEFIPWLRERGLVERTIGGLRRFISELLSPSEDGPAADFDLLGVAASEIRSRLSVSTIGTSFVIEIVASSESPVRAAEIANAVAERYLQGQVEEKLRASEREIAFLETRAEKLRAELIAAEQKVEDFKKSAAMQGHSAALAVELRELQRDAETSRVVYEQVLVSMKERRERGGFQEADARIISAAEAPSSPSSPQKVKLTLIAFAVGAMGAAVGFLVKDARRHTILTEDDVERCCGLPVIGNLPEVKEAKSPIEVLDWMSARPFSALAEAVRWLWISLGNRLDGIPRIIVVTSALPGEGKSTLAMLMAQKSAASGRKTLLVDADLRRKFISKAFGITGAGAHDIEEHGFVVFNLDEVIEGDHRLLSGRVFLETLTAARERYDTTIVDAPPALSVSDVAVLCQNADAVIMACRWNHTPEGALELAVRQLKLLGVRVAGLALTRVDLKRQAKATFTGAGYALRRSMAYYSDDTVSPDAAAKSGGKDFGRGRHRFSVAEEPPAAQEATGS